MRAIVPGIVVLCGWAIHASEAKPGARGSAATPTTSTTAPAPFQPPLSKLVGPRRLHLLLSDERGSRCESFEVTTDPASGRGSFVAPNGDELSTATNGSSFHFVSRSRHYERGGRSTGCHVKLEVREVPGGLDASGSRWFEQAADCKDALRTRAPVATDLSECQLEEEPPLRVQASAQRRFESVLRSGGTLYVFDDDDDACVAHHAAPRASGRADVYVGTLWSVAKDGARTGRVEYDYELVRDAMAIRLGNPFTTWNDEPPFNNSAGLGQRSLEHLSYRADVAIANTSYYVTAAACRAKRVLERERTARHPPPRP